MLPKIGVGKSKKYIDRKLTLRTLILAIVFSVAFIFGVYRAVVLNLNPWVAFAALISGLLLGLAIGRVLKIVWNETNDKVIAKLDMAGIAILAIYTVFALLRERIFSQILTGENLSLFLLWFSIGIIAGRMIIFRKMVLDKIKKDKFGG